MCDVCGYEASRGPQLQLQMLDEGLFTRFNLASLPEGASFKGLQAPGLLLSSKA